MCIKQRLSLIWVYRDHTRGEEEHFPVCVCVCVCLPIKCLLNSNMCTRMLFLGTHAQLCTVRVECVFCVWKCAIHSSSSSSLTHAICFAGTQTHTHTRFVSITLLEMVKINCVRDGEECTECVRRCDIETPDLEQCIRRMFNACSPHISILLPCALCKHTHTCM